MSDATQSTGAVYAELDALKADNEALRKALEVVLDDLMYREHKRVIDFARARLAKHGSATP